MVAVEPPAEYSVIADIAGHDMLAAALAYARLGWHVFPLHSPGKSTYCDCGNAACAQEAKHPWMKGGFHGATTDEATIRRWWRKWPRANIGVACGASGLVVLDVDPRHGGDTALIELVKRYSDAQHGQLTAWMQQLYATLVAETGGGGEHLVYTPPADVNIRNSQELDDLAGLDVRGDGGYIVVAPSMHASGARYLWRSGISEPTRLPDWLLVALTRPKRSQRSQRLEVPLATSVATPTATAMHPAVMGAAGSASTGSRWLGRALSTAHDGNRNDRGFWLACQLRDSGLTAEAAIAVLESYAASVPGDDYTLSEALHSLRSAYDGRPPRERARAQHPILQHTKLANLAGATPARSAFSTGAVPSLGGASTAAAAAVTATSAITATIPPRSLVNSTAMAYRNATGGAQGQAGGLAGVADDVSKMGESAPTQAAASETRQRFQFLTDVELENQPPPEWLVNGILVQGTRCMIYGEPGSYKSFLALDLALCIATGTPWHGHQTRAGRVVYIAGEGKGGMGKRITAWKLYHGHEDSAPISILDEAAQLLRGGDVVSLLEAMALLPEPPVAIVFDTLARSIVGGDENSSQDMGTMIAAVDALHAATGALIILIHHKARGGHNARGSTAMPGGMDTMLDLSRDGTVVTLHCEKQKEDVSGWDIQLRFQITLHADNSLESSGVLVPTGERSVISLPRSAQVALSILRDAGTLDWSTWRDSYLDQSGQSPRAFDNARRALEDEGMAVRSGGFWRITAKGAKWRPE